MNIFVVDLCPVKAAKLLPDKIVNKMAVETAQMLGVNLGKFFYNWGTLPKKDGDIYKEDARSVKNHVCTRWMREDLRHMSWCLVHGLALCHNHLYIKDTLPFTYVSLQQAKKLFIENTQLNLDIYKSLEDSDFIRAMDDDLKFNEEIDTVTAYQQYMMRKSYFNNGYTKREQPQWKIIK